MSDLEQQLAELSTAIEWPATPALRATLPGRLHAGGQGRPKARLVAWSGGNRWILGATATLVIVAALFAYTPSREAIASWVNLHVSIQRVHQLPTPSPLRTGQLGEGLGLGAASNLAQARRGVAWPISVPSFLGAPDRVYLIQPPEGPALGEVTLVYASRSGVPVSGLTGVSVLITEARGQVAQDFFGKMLGPGTTLEQVTVAGQLGFWIAGQPNVFFFVDANGNVRSETLRLATNTLIFDDNGTVVRIEGQLTEAQALQIAASMS